MPDESIDNLSLYCSAEWYTARVPAEASILAAITENPSNRSSVAGHTVSNFDAMVEKVLGGDELSTEERLGLPQLVQLIAKRWMPGRHLSVACLGGSATQCAKVRRWVQEWSTSSVRFDFATAPGAVADIRVAFDAAGGNHSLIGTDNLTSTGAGTPTMNLASVTDTSSDQSDRAFILHEFGHALGFVHEHQSPVAAIKWNTANVYSELGGPPNNWTKSMVDVNVLNPFASPDVQHSDFDPSSIMVYPIPRSWTLDGFHVDATFELSPTDIAKAGEWYPFQRFVAPQTALAFGQDAAGTFMLSSSGTLDRRRRHGLTWQPYENDFASGGPTALSQLELLRDQLSFEAGNELFGLADGNPIQMIERVGVDKWSGRGQTSPGATGLVKILPYVPPGTGLLSFFGLDAGGVLGQGNWIDEGIWTKYISPVLGAPKTTDVTMVITRAALELFVVDVANGSQPVNMRLGAGIQPAWTPIPYSGKAARLYSAPHTPQNDVVMIDDVGMVSFCGLESPVSSRKWGLPTNFGSPALAITSTATSDSGLVAAVIADGRLEVRTWDNLYLRWGAWANFMFPGRCVAARVLYADGAVELLAWDDKGAAYHCTCQDGPNQPWTDWSLL